jgi:hypothetical protein
MLEESTALIGGTTLMKAAEQCDVSYTTAFRWRHRLLDFVSQKEPTGQVGSIASEEAKILESHGGKRSYAPRKRRPVVAKGRES